MSEDSRETQSRGRTPILFAASHLGRHRPPRRLARRAQGKSWRWGFALGFFFSTAGLVLAALPPRNSST